MVEHKVHLVPVEDARLSALEHPQPIEEGVGEIERRMDALVKAARLVLSIDPFIDGYEELQAAIDSAKGETE